MQKATDIARSMVTRLGMAPALGAVAYDIEAATFHTPAPGMLPSAHWYNEATAAKTDAALLQFIDDALGRAIRRRLSRAAGPARHREKDRLIPHKAVTVSKAT